jgi:predicted deacylase
MTTSVQAGTEPEYLRPEEFKARTFAPGTKQRFLIHVGELATGSRLAIPVMVIAGKRSGPTVFIGAGQHGEEPAGMAAVAAVAQRLTVDEVKGTVIVVPVQNPPAWAFRSRHFPMDAPNPGDVAGMQSGDPEGVMSSRVVSVLVDAIAAKAKFALDVHATHLDSINYPRTMVTITGAEPEDVQAQRLEMGRAIGYEIIHLWKRAGHGGVDAILNRKGVATVAIEAGEGWRALEPFPSMLARGIHNFLKYTGTIDGKPDLPALQVEITNRYEVAATRGGMSHLKVKPGDFVEKGQVLAEIRNMFGDVIEELRSPFNGIIVRCSLLPTVATGARVCNVYQTDRKEWATRKMPALEQKIMVSGLA